MNSKNFLYGEYVDAISLMYASSSKSGANIYYLLKVQKESLKSMLW